MVVLASRGSEEPHADSAARALAMDQARRSRSLHVAHHDGLTGARGDPRNGAAPDSARGVVACVNVPTTGKTESSLVSASIMDVLSKLVRSEDRICIAGAGRFVVAFDGVRPSLSAGVLGARLASSVVAGLAGTPGMRAGVLVGVADGSPGSDDAELTFAAIDAAGSTGSASGARHLSRSFVVSTATLRPGLPTIARRVLGAMPENNGVADVGSGAKRTRQSNVAPGTVFVIDAAPVTAGVPGPLSRAVASIVESSGLAVAGTLAPASRFDAAALIPGWPVPKDTLAILVVHPGSVAADADPGAALERPALLTHSLRQSGLRVLAVSVGASNIALAECVMNGAEDAFGIADLPEGLAAAMASTNGQSEQAESEAGATDVHPPRVERVARLLLLTRSERRVLHHLSAGWTATEIAESLVLSISTVRSHIRSILRKLEVSSQLAAVAIARDQPQLNSEPERPARVTQPAGVAVPGR
jgi:two-component system, NarL family, nitrate/nitrite response regulator NarL